MPIPRSGTAGLGVGLYLLGVGLFSMNDALGKWLVADYGVGQLMMLRSIGAVIVLAPMILSLRVNLIDPHRAPLQVLRILCAAVDTFAFYYATRYHAARRRDDLLYGDPAHRHRVSAPLLGEKVERFRWIAVLIGFVGVIIALRPSPQMFSWAAPLALFGATTFALSQTITRELRGVHWLPLVLWQFVGKRPHRCGDRSLGLDGHPPLFDLGLMALVGVVSMICFICIVRALALARAAVLAPLQYSAIPVGGDHGLARLARRSRRSRSLSATRSSSAADYSSRRGVRLAQYPTKRPQALRASIQK